MSQLHLPQPNEVEQVAQVGDGAMPFSVGSGLYVDNKFLRFQSPSCCLSVSAR